ncbi:hypothetical protein [Paraburkholderia unamae]|uniref:hypothetical protein n=1 Tax=Paraburkholderia unamae TaxID=219649 RepID=UPI001CC600B6|nr:hypothetical protein [Paraburkholderia unamae]
MKASNRTLSPERIIGVRELLEQSKKTRPQRENSSQRHAVISEENSRVPAMARVMPGANAQA